MPASRDYAATFRKGATLKIANPKEKDCKMQDARRIQRLAEVTALIGTMILIVFWLVVATFPKFFFFNPLGGSNTLRRFELVISTIGWIGISTIVPILLFLMAYGKNGVRKYLPFAALLYPLSLIVSQITIYVQTGSAYISYLKNFPIFIFTDVILPVLIMFLWHDLKVKPRVDL